MNLISYLRLVLVMMILFLAPVLTLAAEELESLQTKNMKGPEKSEDERNNKNEFSRGTRKWRTYASFAGGDRSKGNLYALHFGYGKFLWDQFSFNVDVFGTYIRSGIDDNGVGYGLDLIIRKHFLMENDEIFPAGWG